MTIPFDEVPECICDRCSCELNLDDTITGPDGETLCDSCAIEVQDEWDGLLPDFEG
jgi:hypothetical protein